LYQNALVPELVSSTSVAYGSEDFRNVARSDGFKETNRFLQHLIDGDTGIFLLTGEEGVGKTTALRYAKHNAPDNVVVIIHSFRRLDVDNLSDLLGHTLGVKVPMDLPPEARALRYFLKLGTIRSKGKRLVLMLDNVRELHYSGAEMLKALVKMKDKSGPLISVLLCGNPELNSVLDSSYRWGIHRLIRKNHVMEGFTRKELDGLVDNLIEGNPELEFPLQPSALPSLAQLSEGNPGKVLKLLEGGTQIAYDYNYQSISSRMLKGARSGNFRTVGHISVLFAIKALVVFALILLVPITLFQSDLQQRLAGSPPADITSLTEFTAADTSTVTTSPVVTATSDDQPEIVATADEITLQEIAQDKVIESAQQQIETEQNRILEPLEAMQAILDRTNPDPQVVDPLTQATLPGPPTVLDSFNLRIPSEREYALLRLRQFAKPNQSPTE